MCHSLLFLGGMGVPGSAHAAGPFPELQLKPAWTNIALQRPVWLCEAPDWTRRIFVVEQRGTVLILPLDRQATQAEVFLDISARKPYAGNEEGLLALAFHPLFNSNGKLYLYYTDHGPRQSRLSEWHVARDNPNRVDPASERVLLEIPQPYENHNGGTLLFGPDKMLYLSLGDGGAANDPHAHAQNTFSLLGKILRIDVETRTGALPYGIPTDNPHPNTPGWRGEIWALGLRNVWRMSFDRETGELWAGDVGQNLWEEVDRITKGGNYGWRLREGFHPFNTNDAAAGLMFIDPVLEYPHNPKLAPNSTHGPGLSITGGSVYRGQKIPALRGVYVYADFALGTIWGLRYEHDKIVANDVLIPHPKGLVPLRNVASFGEDGRGELFLLTFEGPPKGRIYEIEGAAH
jgi:glucose/arabinose dehydrogenase